MKNFRKHFRDYKKSFTAERRLCRGLFGFGGDDTPEVKEPEAGVNIDPQDRKESIIDNIHSPFLTRARKLLEAKMGKEMPIKSYIQLTDDAEWRQAFKSLHNNAEWIKYKGRKIVKAVGVVRPMFIPVAPMAAIPVEEMIAGEHAVHDLWSKLSAKERHNLFKEYMHEYFPGVDLNARFQSIEARGFGDVNSEAEYELMVELRKQQMEGDNTNPEVRESLVNRYKPRGELTINALYDYVHMTDQEPGLRDEARILNPSTVTAGDLIAQLPDSRLKGALKLGIINDEDAKILVAKNQSREIEKATQSIEIRQELLGLKRNIVSKLGSSDVLESPERYSDVVWEEYNKLGTGQKALLGFAGIAIAVMFLKKLFDKDASRAYKLGALTTLCLGGYFIGGDKIVHGIGDRWAMRNKKGQSASESMAEDSDTKVAMEFLDACAAFAAAHGETPERQKFRGKAVLGNMPLSLVASEFIPINQGRSGRLTIEGDLKQGLENELMKYEGMTEKNAKEIMETMKGPECGDWLAHIFFAYAMYADELSKADREANKEIFNELSSKLGGVGINADSKVETIGNFDNIPSDVTYRHKYETVQAQGQDAALRSNKKLCDFLISITPELQV